jgi:SAM-dependent methyltransferase
MMGVFQQMHSKAHHKAVFERRIQILAEALANFLPRKARVLDVGCGSGTLAKAIMTLRPDVKIEGIDVLVRPDTDIPVTAFDGDTIPFPDRKFDVTMIVDVLHHTDDPARVMAEAQRVSKQGIVIKDHFRDGLLAGSTLRFMDWVGNASHGVRLPYNYLSNAEWRSTWAKLGLNVECMVDRLGLYPVPFTWLFDRKLHFVARLS